MQRLSYPRVAVIGGGIAGVGAAWALNRSGIKFELFEQASSLGGHARTMEIPTSVGPRCIAPAAKGFFDNIYFNFFELLRQAGVPYESPTLSFAHQDADGQVWSNTGAKTALGRRLDNEQRRFTAAMLKGLTPEEFGSDIASYLASHGYSEEFTTKVVRPCSAALTTVPLTGAFGDSYTLWRAKIGSCYFSRSFLICFKFNMDLRITHYHPGQP